VEKSSKDLDPIYIKKKHNSVAKIWGRLDHTFSKEAIGMATKHMKRISTLLLLK